MSKTKKTDRIWIPDSELKKQYEGKLPTISADPHVWLACLGYSIDTHAFVGFGGDFQILSLKRNLLIPS